MKPAAQAKALQAKDLAKNTERAASLLKAIAHPARLEILCHLSGGQKTVGELERLCGASQSSVSQYLHRMRSERLVEAQRSGNFVYYGVADANVLDLIRSLHRMFCKS